MLNKYISLLSITTMLWTACGESSTPPIETPPTEITPRNVSTKTVAIQLLSDEDYPDNPDIGFRSTRYNQVVYDKLSIQRKTDFSYNFTFENKAKPNEKITFYDINVFEYIPSVPEWVRGDEYLTHIGIINQEWNRMQLHFSDEHFKIEGDSLAEKVTRVDIARNCLNAYLWEIIAFEETEEGTLPYYHGWFDFPRDWYADMFNKKNDLDFETYRAALEDWVEPPNKVANLTVLRQVEAEKSIDFKVLNNELYPLEGARKKKAKNIIVPKEYTNIQDFLTDSTQYATFMPPGFYTRSEPRKTTLSRFESLEKVFVRKVVNPHLDKNENHEFHLQFYSTNYDTTSLLLSGITLKKIPVLAPEQAHKGWKMPMGIANHSFYTAYEAALANPQMKSPFFSLLLDNEQKWLDSHAVGIDGCLLFFEDKARTKLHFYILSFERHSFVGHFVLTLK